MTLERVQFDTSSVPHLLVEEVVVSREIVVRNVSASILSLPSDLRLLPGQSVSLRLRNRSQESVTIDAVLHAACP